MTRGEVHDLAGCHTRKTARDLSERCWRLQDAEARLGEVVKRARDDGPQRVTLHGKDAVVIVSAEAFDRDRERHTGRRLVGALAISPLRSLELERPFVTGRVRDVDL